MPVADKVIVEFEAKIDAYNRDVLASTRKSEAAFSRIEKSSERMGQRLGGAFKFAGVAAAGFVASIGVDTITRAISEGLNYAASLGEVATQLGVTTDALQEYRFAGSQAGLATEEVDQALSQLTRRIGEGAAGTKAQAEAFQKLGISLKDAKGNVIATGDAIPLIAEGLLKIQSPAERATILMDLFGRAGQKLEPLLAGGAAGVNGLRDAAQKLGIVLSSEQIAKADETADKLDALKQVLAANIAGTVSDNADSILTLANALASLVVGAGNAIKALKELYKVAANKPGNLFETVTGFNFGTGEKIRTADAMQGRAVTAQANKAGAVASGRAFSPQGRKGGKFAGDGLAGILGTDGLGTPGVGTGADIKNIGTLLVAELLGPTKVQAVAINAATVEIQRQNADLALALADLSGSVTERAAAEKLRIDADAAAERERLNADKDLTKATRDELLAVNDKLASARKQLVDQRATEEATAATREAAENLVRAREQNLSLEIAALDAEAGVTRSTKARSEIEARILALQQQEETARLEAAIAAGEIADASKARADLARKQGAERTGQSLGQLSPGGQYLDDLRVKAANANEELEGLAVNGLRSLSDGIGDAIANGGNLGDVLEDSFKRIISQVISLGFELLIIKPLLESLGGGLGGSGGILGFLGGIFGRAGGGPVRRGQPYVIGETGKSELFVPDSNGTVIPAGRLSASGGNSGMSVIRLELSGDINARMVSVAQDVSIEVTRAAAPSIVDASVSETFRRGGRPRM